MKNSFVALVSLFVVACEPPSNDSSSGASELPETRHLSAVDYEDFIATPGKLAVVMFHADWCGPCKIQGPVVEELVEEFEGQVVFGMVDVDDSGEMAQSLGVNGIPDLRLFRDGVMVDAMKGAIPKEQVRSHLAIQVSQLGAAEEAPPESKKAEPAIRPMSKEWRPPGLEPR